MKCTLRLSVATTALLAAFIVDTSCALETSSNRNAVGDFVAQGLGLTRDATPSMWASTSAAANVSSLSINSTNAQATVPSSAAEVSTTSALLNGTSPGSAASVHGNVSWPSAQNDDQCWAQWTSYWSWTASHRTDYYPTKTTTVTTTNTYTMRPAEPTTDGYTTTITYTAGSDNGGFAASYTTWTETDTLSWTVAFAPGYTSTGTRTWTDISYHYNKITTPSPSCNITATPYSSCQQYWSSYITALGSAAQTPLSYTYISPPGCQAASITGDACMSFKDLYVAGNEAVVGYWNSYSTRFSNGFIQTTSSDGSEGWFWNKSLSLAPG